jgi:hypothetical protein
MTGADATHHLLFPAKKIGRCSANNSYDSARAYLCLGHDTQEDTFISSNVLAVTLDNAHPEFRQMEHVLKRNIITSSVDLPILRAATPR